MTRRLIERFRGAAGRLLGPATDQEPPDLARMGGHRSPHARPIDRSRRGHARPLHRDGALPHQEHHAKARRPLARRRGRGRRAPPARRPADAAGPYCARTTSATPERSTAAAWCVRSSAVLPAARPRRSNRLRMRRCAKREGDRQLVGAHGLRAVPVIPPAEVGAQTVVDDLPELLQSIRGPARARVRARNSVRRVRCNSDRRAAGVTCSGSQARWARTAPRLSERTPCQRTRQGRRDHLVAAAAPKRVAGTRWTMRRDSAK